MRGFTNGQFCCALFLGFGCSVFAAPTFKVLQTRELSLAKIYSAEKNQAHHQAGLKVVLLQDSGWTSSEIEKRLQVALPIFLQCDLGFSQVILQTVRVPEKYLKTGYASDYAAGSVKYELATQLKSQVNVTLFFVKVNILGTFNSGRILSAAQAAMYPQVPLEVNGTAWIPADEYLTPVHSGSSSTVAHELLHIFADRDHHDDTGNLMSVHQSTNLVLAEDCARVLQHPSVNYY